MSSSRRSPRQCPDVPLGAASGPIHVRDCDRTNPSAPGKQGSKCRSYLVRLRPPQEPTVCPEPPASEREPTVARNRPAPYISIEGRRRGGADVPAYWDRPTLVALLATAVGLVIVLARESSALADRYERLRRLATQVHAGMYVPAHETATITGAPITLAEVSPGRRQLLFFLTTTCPYCRASLPAWKELAAQAEALGHIAIGVALDSLHLLGPYAREHELSFPVVAFDDQRTTALYRAFRVPLTMVVDGTGRVRFAHIGVLTDAAAIDSVRAVLAPPSPAERRDATAPRPVSSPETGP